MLYQVFSVSSVTARVLSLPLTVLAQLLALLIASQLWSAPPNPAPTILILNSYHKGYSWSDQIVDGLESSLLHAFPGADVRVEYMDTKRNSSPEYLHKLSAFYWEKYHTQKFDLIVAADDNAIDMVLEWGDISFPDTPVVFCGANSLASRQRNLPPRFTGVIEYADIKKTLETALQLMPDIKRLVVINDNTNTGKLVGLEFDRVMRDLGVDLELIRLPDLPLAELCTRLGEYGDGTLVLLLAYLTDRDGLYYDPELTATRLSAASRAPIFTVWDFYFDHGVVGGVLTSGFLQGEEAAELGIRILHGESPAAIEVVQQGGNVERYDYRQLQRFAIPVEKIPRSAKVKNIAYGHQKQILVVNSYSVETAWTSSIMEGIREQFANSGEKVKLFVEFMDTKEFFDKPYLHSLVDRLRKKYSSLTLDVILVSDDNAYNFVASQRPFLFPDVPIVFCGVNYLSNANQLVGQNITGVVEDYDILGTIRLGLDLFPDTKRVFVINDDTTSGEANRQRLEQVLPNISPDITLEYSGQISMLNLQQKLASLQSDTLVLLMSFTRDKDNQHFSYQESGELVVASSVRPVFGFWDFYLENGVIGGAMTTGRDQGRTAAQLALRILRGEPVSSLPIVETSPVTPIVDYRVMKRFGLVEGAVPPGVHIQNRPPTIMEQYRSIVLAIMAVLAALFLLISVQALKIFYQGRKQRRLLAETETDALTGVKNRTYLGRNLTSLIDDSVATQKTLSLCYFDLDNLKGINDIFGHDAGDRYILQAVACIRRHIREDDAICRVGGDEFIVLLANCGRERAARICEMIHADLVDSGIFSGYRVGFSYGISTLDLGNPQAAGEMMKMADQNMYRHKSAGKSRGEKPGRFSP